MIKAIPRGAKISIDPYVVPASWLANPFWAKPHLPGGQGPIWDASGDFITTLKPEQVATLQREGRCWVVTSSTIADRAKTDPTAASGAAGFYKALDATSTVVWRTSPLKNPQPTPKFDFDRAYLYYDGSYTRPGPTVTVRRLHGGRCGPSGR